MNDNYRDLKDRARKLQAILLDRGLSNMEFAQAVSRLHRAERRGDRSREPSAELRDLLERAENLGRSLVSG